MDIEPAHVNQVRDAGGGRFVEISADAGMVVDDLKRIDESLGVRLSLGAAEPFWAVYCKPNDHDTYLVLTVKAYQNTSGTWEGLDQRVVKRIEMIGSERYDYAGAVQARNEQAIKARDQRVHDQLEQTSVEGYRMLRKLIGRNCGHVRVTRDLTA